MNAFFLTASILLILFLALFALVAKRRFYRQRDGFFYFFYFQAILYLLVSPAVIYIGSADGYIESYPELWFWVAALYFFPLTLTYLMMVRNLKNFSGLRIWTKSKRSNALFFIITASLIALYYHFAIKNGYLFRRIGSESAAIVFSNLSIFDLFLIKLHDLAFTPLFLVTLAIIASEPGEPKQSRNLIILTAWLLGIDQIFSAVINSRLLLIYFFTSSGLIFLWCRGKNLRILNKWTVPILLFFGYLFILIINYRAYLNTGQNGISGILNPLYAISSDDGQLSKHEWFNRTDCLDLIAHIFPVFDLKGLPLGEAWINPVVSIFGVLFDPSWVAQMKATGLTTAKSYLMTNYTNITSIDYQSCGLTDAFGNFGILGFLIAGCVHGIGLGLTVRALLSGRRGYVFLLAVMAAYYFMFFEQEFIMFIIGWIRVIPVFLFLALLVPIKKYEVISSKRIV